MTFRPLAAVDMPLLHGWLTRGVVRTWYARRDLTLEGVTEHYMELVEARVRTRGFVLLVDGSPAGFWKTYLLADYPEYAAALGAEPGWAGMDFFIGEDAHRGRGLGRRAHEEFLRSVVFVEERVTACVAGPDPENHASIRSLEHAGFRRLRDARTSAEDIEAVMVRARSPAD